MSPLASASALAPLALAGTPFVAAALITLFSNRGVGLLVAIGAAWACAALGVVHLREALAQALPAGDAVGAASAALIAVLGAVAVIGAGLELREHERRAEGYGLALALCVIGGWTGALFARNLVQLFLAAESAWLASVGLLALGARRDRGALNAALRMLVMGGVAAVLFILGAALWSGELAGVALSDLALARVERPTAAAAGTALIFLSLAIKAAAAPFHAWFAIAISRGASAAVLTLGLVGIVGALAALIRFAALAGPAPALGSGLSIVAAALGAASVAIGSMQAVGAASLLRMCAYAGVAQAGCVLIAVALGSPAGMAASLIQLAALAASLLALLGGVVASGVGAAASAIDGLGRRAPISGAVMTIGALSLMGTPLTLGFLGRWRIVEVTLGVEWWWAAALVIFSLLAGAVYSGRLIERLYFRRSSVATPAAPEPWRLALAPALAAGVVAILLGAEPSWLLRIAEFAGEQMGAAQ